MSSQLAAFIESLRNSGLLQVDQMSQIEAWANEPDVDPTNLARDIASRGWLTSFQIKQFWKKKGPELFLNQYVLLEPLGEGGMGVVYKARHRKMDRIVALKVIRKERVANADAIRRFQREIQAAGQLVHENVVMAYDAAQAGEQHFFAMEYVEGQNLAKLVKDKGLLPVKDACDYIRQAACGLQHAFEKSMVHRDIKPSNLLLSRTQVVKIMDMGLARLQEQPYGEDESRITQENLAVGTPDFLAPEQARNARNADTRSDIYSLGCTLYYLLTGQVAYPKGTPNERMLQHAMSPLPTIPRDDLPEGLQAIVHKMMAKRPEERFQTPIEVAHAIEPYSGLASAIRSGKISNSAVLQSIIPKIQTQSLQFDASEPSTEAQFKLAPTPRKTRRRKDPTKWNLWIAGFIGLVLLVGGGYGIYQLTRSAKKETPVVDDPKITNKYGIDLILIKPGSFLMGSPDTEPNREADEGPQHEVEISRSFYLGATEITVRQYKEVMGGLPKGVPDTEDDQEMPIIVSQNDAMRFIKRLNSDENSGRKEGWEFRLPTEAEWEYACRAGGTTVFSYGDALDASHALINSMDRKKPDHVGKRKPNAWGLYDMHGNVAEWCADRYEEDFYANSASKDPLAFSQKRAKAVVRGGGWNDPALKCRSAARRAEFPEKILNSNIGFRIALVRTGQ